MLIGVHRELKGLVGNNILNIGLLTSESTFQKEVQASKIISIPDGPIQPPVKIQHSAGYSFARNPKIGRLALQNAEYKCELDSSHITFSSKSTGKPFLEVHHLVPMEKQGDFPKVSLDVPDNIIALCPNCHRKIHLATEEEKRPLLTKLYNSRTIK